MGHARGLRIPSNILESGEVKGVEFGEGLGKLAKFGINFASQVSARKRKEKQDAIDAEIRRRESLRRSELDRAASESAGDEGRKTLATIEAQPLNERPATTTNRNADFLARTDPELSSQVFGILQNADVEGMDRIGNEAARSVQLGAEIGKKNTRAEKIAVIRQFIGRSTQGQFALSNEELDDLRVMANGSEDDLDTIAIRMQAAGGAVLDLLPDKEEIKSKLRSREKRQETTRRKERQRQADLDRAELAVLSPEEAEKGFRADERREDRRIAAANLRREADKPSEAISRLFAERDKLTNAGATEDDARVKAFDQKIEKEISRPPLAGFITLNDTQAKARGFPGAGQLNEVTQRYFPFRKPSGTRIEIDGPKVLFEQGDFVGRVGGLTDPQEGKEIIAETTRRENQVEMASLLSDFDSAAVGVSGAIIENIAGPVSQVPVIGEFLKGTLEDLLGGDVAQVQEFRSRVQLLSIALIAEITGEDSGRTTAEERKIAKEQTGGLDILGSAEQSMVKLKVLMRTSLNKSFRNALQTGQLPAFDLVTPDGLQASGEKLMEIGFTEAEARKFLIRLERTRRKFTSGNK